MTAHTNSHYRSVIFGITLFCFSCFCATLVTVIMKVAYIKYKVPMVGAIFWKSLFSFIAVLPMLVKNKFSFWKKGSLLQNFNRNFIFLILTYFWMYGVMMIPVSDATILNQLAPIIACIFAAVIFKEKISRKLWIVLYVCFLASVVILKPSGDRIFNYGYILVIISIVMKAISSIYTKKLSSMQDIYTTSYFYAILTASCALPITLIFEPNFVSNLDVRALPYFAICGALYVLRTFAWAKACELCTVSITQPFDFSRIIFAAILSFILLGETTDIKTMVAGFAIFISYIYLMSDKRIK